MFHRGPAGRRGSLPALSEAARGKRLLFLVAGPRGEVQPLVALSAGCNKAGFQVLVVTQSCHQGFFEDFGVGVADCDVVSELDEPMAPLVSVALPAGTDGPTDLEPGALRLMWDYAIDFQPDLIVTARPCSAASHAFARSLGVPVMEVVLQLMLPTATARSPLGERPGSPGCLRYWMWIRFRRELYRRLQGSQLPVLRSMLKATKGGDIGVWRTLEGNLLDTLQPVAPGPVAISPLVAALPCDRPAEFAESGPLGYVTVSRQEQLTKADDYFGCRSFLRAFVESEPDEPPIYIGFGPCTDGGPVHLTELAVGAAMHSNTRAAVLCGVAGLGWSALAHSAKDLQAYAEQRVVFVGSAPHEMLFPRCSVVVHHGGVGTSASAMRAGVPQLVLPTTPEQQLEAAQLVRLGVGLDLGPLDRCDPEVLARALRRVLADETMLKRCKELGDALQKEDGLKACIEYFDRFFADHVATGSWAAREKRRLQELQVLRSGVESGCLTWLGRVVCGRGRTDFRPRLP
mmetsp:Transcript_96503/g.270076  ORF Transcript_96503/g.270076 Transcript_96503/m.270076 type:complete len:516 (-) Transcript_96503:26-1573(-)